MGSSGSSLGRSIGALFREVFPGVPGWALALVVVALFIGYFVFDDFSKKKALSRHAFRGMGIIEEPGTLFLVAQGAQPPRKLYQDLRPFNTGEEAFRYAYPLGDEADFSRIVLIPASGERIEFQRNDGTPEEQEIARLDVLMKSATTAAA